MEEESEFFHYLKEIEKIVDIKIDIIGFDTGKGMPKTNDYRDLTDKYVESDFPMIDKKIESYGCKLVLGDLKKTIPAYKNIFLRLLLLVFLRWMIFIHQQTCP